MLFKEFGPAKAPTIMLLHGGGLSWWSWRDVVSRLEKDWHVVVPVIDGYGEDAARTFSSIEYSADNVIDYIGSHCDGRVFALGGLSIGAQIVVEALGKAADIAEHAIIESALVRPIRATRQLTVPAVQMSYGLIRKRWFAKLQARQLCVPEDMFEQYYEDSIKMSKASLVNTVLSNGTYRLKAAIKESKAKTLVIAGEKEMAAIRKSAQMLHHSISNSRLYIAPGMRHGELSLVHSGQYVALISAFFAKE